MFLSDGVIKGSKMMSAMTFKRGYSFGEVSSSLKGSNFSSNGSKIDRLKMTEQQKSYFFRDRSEVPIAANKSKAMAFITDFECDEEIKDD